MRVRIAHATFDPNKTPILLHLTKRDRELIASMPEESDVYAVYPTEDDPDDIQAMMIEFASDMEGVVDEA